MDDLSLEEAVDRLGESVVAGISNAADGGLNARFGRALGVADAVESNRFINLGSPVRNSRQPSEAGSERLPEVN